MPILAFSRDAVASFISNVRFAYFSSFPLALRGTRDHMRNFILTRGRYISEGYFYFLSYYSRAYEKLFSDDLARLQFITSLKNVRGSITLKTYCQGYLYIFFLQSKHNLSVKTQLLRHVLYNFAPFILPSSP